MLQPYFETLVCGAIFSQNNTSAGRNKRSDDFSALLNTRHVFYKSWQRFSLGGRFFHHDKKIEIILAPTLWCRSLFSKGYFHNHV